MKIVVPTSKPRAKWLNDILRSKRSEAHVSLKNPNRSKTRTIVRREISEAMRTMLP